MEATVNLPVLAATSVAHAREVDTLRDLTAGLLALADQADQLAEQGNLAALGDGLGRLREFRKAVTDLERHIESHVANLMTGDVVNLDDEVTLERRRGNVRKRWQSEDLLRHLVGDRLINPDTGENVYETLTACLPLTSSLSWRAGALRERGVSPDDWCVSEPGRVSVAVQVREDR